MFLIIFVFYCEFFNDKTFSFSACLLGSFFLKQSVSTYRRNAINGTLPIDLTKTFRSFIERQTRKHNNDYPTFIRSQNLFTLNACTLDMLILCGQTIEYSGATLTLIKDDFFWLITFDCMFDRQILNCTLLLTNQKPNWQEITKLGLSNQSECTKIQNLVV